MAFDKNAHIAAIKAAAEQRKAQANPQAETEIAKRVTVAPEDCPERIRIVFDDSGSMEGMKMTNAKEGTVEFLRNCIPNQTAVAIHLLNGESYNDSWGGGYTSVALAPVVAKAQLSSDLILVASAVQDKSLQATGGTPIIAIIEQALQAVPRASRIVIFSDGQPDTRAGEDEMIVRAVEMQIPIDTVYLDEGYTNESAKQFLKNIADKTGGIFLHFKKGSSFKDSFKYLAPTKRLMLMDDNFKSRVERGEV